MDRCLILKDVAARILRGGWILVLLLGGGAPAPAEAQGNDGLEQGIYQFLLYQRSEATGLVDSFIQSDDRRLEEQASTYDAALAGLGFLQLNDPASAKRILSFFDRKWTGSGLCNFYHTGTGNCGLEATVHLGPNMWIAVLGLAYAEQTGDRSFDPLVRKIARWGMGLKHLHGAISMGPLRDWGADWPNVVGTESNIVAYRVFRSLARGEQDLETALSFEKEMAGIRDFLNSKALVKDAHGRLADFLVGYSEPGGVSRVSACDVITMMLLVFDPADIKLFFRITQEDLVRLAREKFFVAEDGIQGFDFADEKGSAATGRARMISIEWSMQMATALHPASGSSSGVIDAAFLAQEADKKSVELQGMRFYPYATKDSLQVFPFAPWWQTPAGHPARCGSMASTMWRLFYEKGFNPLG